MDMKKCDDCGNNPATIHLTQIMQDETMVFNLCEECARKKGISISIPDGSASLSMPTAPPQKNITCEGCGMTYSEFKEKGRLGCVACYKVFDSEVDEYFMQVHGATAHLGKKYHRTITNVLDISDLSRLKKELDSAIRDEAFELAASIRDTISNLGSAT